MAGNKPARDKVPKQPSTRHYRQGHGGAFDTHKDRAQWFYQRAAFPLRDAPPEAHEEFWQHPERYPLISGVKWENAGPTNYAGRVTCLVVDPKDWTKLYAGAAAGGVWKSSDTGLSWTPCWPRFLNHNIGALATHPVNSDELYCATGEANLSADSYPGSGIYQTLNGGLTWSPVFVAPGGRPLADVAEGLPRRVGTIAWGLFKDREYRLALGAVSSSESLPAALYLEKGEFGLQPNVFWGARSYNCYAVIFHPTNPGWLYVTIEPRGADNGIWRSEDFGDSWTHLKTGLPPGEACARISLAISSANPKILYALVSARKHGVRGVFRTADGGDTWQEIGGTHFVNESQLSYNNTIAIHPRNPDYVVCGGVDLHLTKDAGANWTQITTGQRGNPGDPFPPNFVHSDHHAIVITPDGIIYSGNDGGVAMSQDGGNTWQDRSAGMITTMFYAADVAQSNSKVFGGGTQDQGTLIAGVPEKPGARVPPATEFTRVLPGDGGWIEFDPDDEEHVFGSTSDLILSRHRRGEPWAFGKQLAGWKSISISPDAITMGERDQRAIAVMEIEPGGHSGHGGVKKVWVGTNRLWQTANDGAKWEPVSPSLDDSAISAIECAAADPRVLYAGTSAGGIFRSTDGGGTWSENLSSAMIPRRVVTRIATHPTRAETVVVTVASTGVPGTSLAQEQSPYSHVFQSDNSGESWQPLDGGYLPDVVYNALAFETQPPYRLFVGGDSGVWVATDPDTGKDTTAIRWASIQGNMPNVVISDLIYHHKDRVLTAATYGRGFWRLSVEPSDSWKVVGPEPEDAPSDVPFVSGLKKDESIPVPVLLSPPDGSLFTNFPRLTHFVWQPVKGAIGYAVTIQGDSGWVNARSSEGPELTIDVGTDGKASWNVCAILPDSRRSPVSAKRSFEYRT